MGKILSCWVLAAVVMAAEAALLMAKDTSCLPTLAPCLVYISAEIAPSKSCCAAIETQINTISQCLCNIIAGGTLVNQLGLNVTAALALLSQCDLTFSAAACSGEANSSGRSSFAMKVSLAALLTITQVYYFS